MEKKEDANDDDETCDNVKDMQRSVIIAVD